MRFDFLTNDDEKSLVPFFSEKTTSIHFNYIWLLAVFLILLWPRNELFYYLEEQSYPTAFLATFVSALLMISYLNLRWGGGEFFQADYFYVLLNKRTASFEEENSFFSYGFVGFIIHISLLILLSLPILIASTVISGISPQAFAKAISVLFSSALFCRMFGFLIYLWCKNHNWLQYHLARLFFILFFFISGAFVSFANPIIVIYFLHKDEKILSHLPMDVYLLHMMVVPGTILLLSVALHVMITHRKKERDPS